LQWLQFIAEQNINMIKVNKITPPTVEVFDPEDNSLGQLNEYEFYDLRLQILKNRVQGYYVMFNGERSNINSFGRLDNWHKDMFNIIESYCEELILLASKMKKEVEND
jgi:hypothetical protein